MFDLENKIGVSTACFYPELTENAFCEICRLKVPVCEIFLNTQSETKPRFLRDIKSKARDNNIKIVSVHPFLSGYEPFLFFSEYGGRRFADSIDLYRQFFEAAQFMESEYIIFHGIGPGKMNLPIDEYNRRFLLIAAEAKKYGCELLHENVGTINHYIHDLKNIRFTLDFKHSVCRDRDVIETIEQAGENIAHIPLNDMLASDSEKVKSCRLPFSGGLDYKKIFKKLNDINYIGNFIIEVYRSSYNNIEEISESLGKLREFLKGMEYEQNI
jgi:sugar phosphate isomerase/epimerase